MTVMMMMMKVVVVVVTMVEYFVVDVLEKRLSNTVFNLTCQRKISNHFKDVFH